MSDGEDTGNLQALLGMLSELQTMEPLSDNDRAEIASVLSGSDDIVIPEQFVEEQPQGQEAASGPSAGREDSNAEDIRSQISKMKLPEKIKCAMFGNATARMLLIRDSNRMIQMFVLNNPRLQIAEVEEFGRNPNMPEQVLRAIAANAVWMRSYALKAALVMNPKTPADVSLKWLRFLNPQDVRRISKSKMVPQVVAVSAKKKLAESEQGKK